MSRSARIVRRAALAAAALAVGCPPVASALASPAGPAVSPGAVRATAGVVPWAKAGPGWAVAEYWASTAPGVMPFVRRATTLYLTSPQGAKYPFFTWPASYTGPPYSLVDWSGDRQRVLVAAPHSPDVPVRLKQISLATRRVVNTFTLPAGASPLGYTRPAGLNLLALRSHAGGSQLVRYDLAGRLQKVLMSGKVLFGAIDAPDGASVIAGTQSGLADVSNTGGSVKRINPPVAVAFCSPVQWWAAGTVLASCEAKGSRYYPRLWLFPMAGGKVTALTPQREGHGPDFGDIAAWRVSGHLDVQALRFADCSEFIGQQWRNGSLHIVSVPTTTGNNGIVTALGARLLAQTWAGACSASSLLWFDPSTNTVKYILHAPATVQGVGVVVPFGRPSTS